MYCRYCGKEVNEDWKICPYCKNLLKVPMQTSGNQGEESTKTRDCKKKNQYKFKILAICFGVAFILVSILVLFNVGNGKKTPQIIEGSQSVADNNLVIDTNQTEDGEMVSQDTELSITDTVALSETQKVIDRWGVEYINKLVPGTYMKESLDRNFNVFCDITLINGKYYMTLMADSRTGLYSEKYNHTVIIDNVMLDTNKMEETGVVYSYDDVGNVTFSFCSYPDGFRIKAEITEAGVKYYRSGVESRDILNAVNGTMYKVIESPANWQKSVLYDEELDDYTLCQVREGAYSNSYMREDYSFIEVECDIFEDEDGSSLDNLFITDRSIDWNKEYHFQQELSLDLSELYETGKIPIRNSETNELFGNLYFSPSGLYIEYTIDTIEGFPTSEINMRPLLFM